MAVTAVAKSTKATIIMNVGTDPGTGKMIQKRNTLSSLASNPDGTKIYNIVDTMADVVAYPIASVETTEVKVLEKA